MQPSPPLPPQDEFGRRWGELERMEGVGREGISAVCSHLATIHLKLAKGRPNEYEELERLYRQLTEGCTAAGASTGAGGAAAAAAGPAFFDGVLKPYTEVRLAAHRCSSIAQHGAAQQSTAVLAASLPVALAAQRWQFGLAGAGATSRPTLSVFDSLHPPLPWLAPQLYVRMRADEYRPPGTSEADAKKLRYLITCLNRLTDRVPEWQPLALAALMQHQLGRLPTAALTLVLEDLERLCWVWVLTGTTKAARVKRRLQVSWLAGLLADRLAGWCSRWGSGCRTCFAAWMLPMARLFCVQRSGPIVLSSVLPARSVS